MKKRGIFLLGFIFIIGTIGMSGIVGSISTVSSTSIIGDYASISGSIIAYFVHETWLGDLNGDGDELESQVRYYDISNGIGGTIAMGRFPAASGSIIAFTAVEFMVEEDLNDDGDTNDAVIRYYDTTTGSLVTIADGWTPSISGSIIAFDTKESDIGEDLNDDGDTEDTIIRYCDISGGPIKTTGKIGRNTSISGSIIVFNTYELWIGDQNGDGDTKDWVIRYYDISNGSFVDIGEVGFPSISGTTIAFSTFEQDISQDLNGDGDVYDSVIRYYNISDGTVTNTGELGRSPSMSGSIIAFDTLEMSMGQDQNGDGDVLDWVVRYYDTSDNTVTNTGEIGQVPSISGSTIAFATPELSIGQDLNGDGDTADTVIRYITLESTFAQKLITAKNIINGLDNSEFRRTVYKTILMNRLDRAIRYYDNGWYRLALFQLNWMILPRIDGCAERGAPDAFGPYLRDWIITCEGQAQVYSLIVDAIQDLESLL